MLPTAIGYRVIYFIISYLLLCIGIALSNRCGLPIIPTDLFPRELADITKVQYSRIKIGYDVTCLTVTALMTLSILRTSGRTRNRYDPCRIYHGKSNRNDWRQDGSACKIRILYDKENSIKSYCLRNCETMYIITPATITTGIRIPRIVTSRSNTTAAIKMTATLPYHVERSSLKLCFLTCPRAESELSYSL